jgi:hypothetical protein
MQITADQGLKNTKQGVGESGGILGESYAKGYNQNHHGRDDCEGDLLILTKNAKKENLTI